MAFDFKLLQMPDFHEEQSHRKLTTDSVNEHRIQNGGIKLLSLPQNASNKDIKPFSLVQIPVKPALKGMTPLIKLPTNVKQNRPLTTRQPLLTVQKDEIESQTLYQLKTKFPLLQKPSLYNSQPKIIKLPVAQHSDTDRNFPRLLNLPINKQEDFVEYRRESQPMGTRNENYSYIQPKFIERVPEDYRKLQRNSNSVRTVDKSMPKQKKRKRLRKHDDENQNIQDTVNVKKSEDYKADNQIMKISKETQTTDDSRKKIKRHKKKTNIMALLEQAALLGSSDISTDDDEDLQMAKNKSYLIKGVEYSDINTNVSKEGISGFSILNHSDGRQKTIEELLTEEMMDKRHESKPAVQNTLHSEFYDEKPTTIKHHIARDTKETSCQTIPDLGLSNITDKPKSSVGLSWKEIIGMSDHSKQNEPSNERSKENKGIQVMEYNPEIDRVEKVSQTDFNFATNVNELLLDSHENERKESKQDFVAKNVTDPATDGGYPWDYIGRVSISDLGTPSDKMRIGQNKHNKAIYRGAKADEAPVRVNFKTPVPSASHPVENQREDHYETTVIQPTGVHFPPEVLLEMRIEDDHIETREIPSDLDNKFISVVETSKPKSEPAEVENFTDSIVLNEIPLQQLRESMEIMQEPIALAHVLSEELPENADDLTSPIISKASDWPESSLRNLDVGIPFSPNSRENDKENLDLQQQRSHFGSDSENAEKLRKIIASNPKDRLENNLRNMSVQLDALDQLHDHLEKELKSSAMLMKTVDTLHRGFFDDVGYSKEKRIMSKPVSKERVESRKKREKPSIEEDLVLTDVNEAVHEKNSATFLDEEASEGMDDEDQQFREKLESFNEFLEEEQNRFEDNIQDDADVLSEEQSSVQDDVMMKKKNSDEKLNSSDGSQVSNLTSLSDSGESRPKDYQVKDDLQQPSQEPTRESEDEPDENEVIRQRLMEKHPSMSARRIKEERLSEESDLKQKIEKKRKVLREWMKNKRLEQQQRYRKEVDEKRQRETRPFTAKQTKPFSSRDGQVTSTKESKKTNLNALRKANYEERIQSANKLMDDILITQSDVTAVKKASRPTLVTPVERQRKRVGANHPFKQPRKQSRKNSVVSVAYGQRKKSERTFHRRSNVDNDGEFEPRDEDVKWLIDNISPSWKDTSFSHSKENELFGEQKSFEDPLHLDLEALSSRTPRTSTNRRSKLKGKLHLDDPHFSGRKSADLHSNRSTNRRSVEAKDFVTETSMEMYRKKTAKLVRESLREYNKELDDFQDREGSAIPFNVSLMTTLDTKNFYDENEIARELKRDTDSEGLTKYRKNTNDAKEVNEILKEYGFLGEDVDQHNNSGTSDLLAEANALLQEEGNEDENLQLSTSIDWEQIDQILKKS